MRRLAFCVVVLAMASTAVAQTTPPPAPAPVDYAAASSWVCRPGEETTCTTGLDAMAISADGSRAFQAFQPAADPPIDCFYVYPTISEEASPYSDMVDSPEVQKVTRAQAGRLTSRCRLYAPLYRQITMTGLRQDMATGERLDWRGPYADVRAAWRWYMANANHGRGVVLIGHSQGAILLQRLIAEEIDGKATQKRLVSAFLAGDPALPVPQGKRVGGVFKAVPLCSAAAEVGCVYVWADYLADDLDADRHFGGDPGHGLVAGCVDPAAPAGGSGELKAYLPKPKLAPDADPPWVQVLGQLSVACVADAQGDVARVTIRPSRYADLLKAAFERYTPGPGWGLHRLDLNLPQGDILDVLSAEGAAWSRR